MITVDLVKRPAEYLVVVDDREAYSTLFEHRRADRVPELLVLSVEREADHPADRRAQLARLDEESLEGEFLKLRTYTALSHGHAAYLARWEYAVQAAACRMAEMIDAHHEKGFEGHIAGWVAVRITDGRSDGELYPDAEDAHAAGRRLGECTVFPVTKNRLPEDECERHLRAMAHQRHGGCTIPNAPFIED